MVRLWLFGLVGVCFGLWLLWGRSMPAMPARDIALPAGQVAQRITVFGTSLSAAPQTWPMALQARLATCRLPAPQVTPVAGPGQGSAWALTRIKAVLETNPDLVLIEFAINDADLRHWISARGSAQNHRALIAALRRARPDLQIALMTMNPAYGLRGWLRPRLAARYQAYHDLAEQEGVGLVDLYPRWLALPADARGLEGDGLHPDPKAAAALIVPVLAGYIAAGGCS